MDDVPELAAGMLAAQEPQGEVTDHGARLLQLGRQREEVAVRDDHRRRDLLLECCANLVLRPRIPQEVARHVLPRLVGVERPEVGRGERAEEESFRLDDGRGRARVHAGRLLADL